MLDGKFSTDTLYADVKSLNQHKYAQIFTHKCGFAAAYPINSMGGNQLGHALQDFIHDFGAPEHLIFDGHKSQVSLNTLFMKTIRKYGIIVTTLLRQEDQNKILLRKAYMESNLNGIE